MTDNVVNLNKARKEREKADLSAQAQQNRARFGQTKGEKAKALSIAEKLKQALDAVRRDDAPKA
jgi:hypothetical protein